MADQHITNRESDVTLPEPLTPPECDLRGMTFMPIDIGRLLDSDLYALSTGDEFKAAFTLWGKSFFQVPAASLPGDERVLAFLSGAGSKWPKVRKVALRGWVKCSDGRLYHPVVAEKAMEAWRARRGYAARMAKARAAKAANNSPPDGGNGSRIPPSITGSMIEPITAPITGSITDAMIGPVTGHKGQGQGQRQGQGQGQSSSLRSEEEDLSDLATLDPHPASAGSQPRQADLATAFHAYNATASDLGLPTARRLDNERRTKLRARLREIGGLDGWNRALEALRASPHCRGDNERNWRADLDFLLSPSRLRRLLEGSYAYHEPPQRHEPPSKLAYIAEFLAADRGAA